MAAALLGIFAGALLIIWSSVGYSALNTTTYARRQNDQMRVLDYLKRDIRRATKVELFNGNTLVTGVNVAAAELKLTIPDYYADSREDDDALGSKTPNAPAITGNVVAYGTPLTVRYVAMGGAAIRQEQGVSRTLASAAGAFSYAFFREANGAIRCRVTFDQPMRGSGTPRIMHRQAETLCLARTELRQ